MSFYILKKKLHKAPFVFFLLTIMLFPAGGIPLMAADLLSMPVRLDGKLLQFDVQPCFRQGVPMFPLRKIMEEIDYDVAWEAEAKRVVLKGYEQVVILYPQNPLYSLNGIECRLDEQPFIQQGRLMVGIDFLQGCAGIKGLEWNEKEHTLCLEHCPESNKEPSPLPEENSYGENHANLAELLLPPENRVQVGEYFDVAVAAPFVEGGYAYEISFFYDPQIIEVIDIKNPSANSPEDYYLKGVNNAEGVATYAQTTLGYREKIPPRSMLAVIEAVALCEGGVPFGEDALKIKLLDNEAVAIPVTFVEKILYAGVFR